MIKTLSDAIQSKGYNVFSLCEHFGYDITAVPENVKMLGYASVETDTIFVNRNILGKPLVSVIIFHGLVHLLHHDDQFIRANSDIADASLLDRDATLSSCEFAVGMYNAEKCDCMSCDAKSVLDYFDLPSELSGDIQRAVNDLHDQQKRGLNSHRQAPVEPS